MEGAARRAGVARVAGLIPELTGDVHLLAGDPAQGGVDALGRNWNVGAGFTLALPLFDRRQGRVREFVAEFDGLMERYVGLGIDLRSLVRAARNRLASTHAARGSTIRQRDPAGAGAGARGDRAAIQRDADGRAAAPGGEARPARRRALGHRDAARVLDRGGGVPGAPRGGASTPGRRARRRRRPGTAGRNVMGSSASQGRTLTWTDDRSFGPARRPPGPPSSRGRPRRRRSAASAAQARAPVGPAAPEARSRW